MKTFCFLSRKYIKIQDDVQDGYHYSIISYISISKCYKNKHQISKYMFSITRNPIITLFLLKVKIQDGSQYGRHYFTKS